MNKMPTIRAGETYRLYYNKGNPNNVRMHIRGIVDEYIVYRVWSKHKQYWCYKIMHPYMAKLSFDSGFLKRIATNQEAGSERD